MDVSSAANPEPVSLSKVLPGRWDDALGGDVGDFRPGSPASQWALSRYLVGRALAESVGMSLLITGLVVLAVAVGLWAAGGPGWAVLVGLVAIFVLVLRAGLLAVLRRLTAAGTDRPTQDRLRAIVADTRKDVLRELRRLGLPGRTWTLPLLARRLVSRRHRAATVDRLRQFDLDRVVPRARVDELHLLLQAAVGRAVPPA